MQIFGILLNAPSQVTCAPESANVHLAQVIPIGGHRGEHQVCLYLKKFKIPMNHVAQYLGLLTSEMELRYFTDEPSR